MLEAFWGADMLPTERQYRIVELVNQRGAMEVAELARLLDVSVVTIRRDLDKLAEEGLIVRSHGGAVSVRQAGTALDPPYEAKRRVRYEEKRRIAEAAARLVEDDETIIVDSGSTTYHMVPHLQKYRNLTIVTTDLLIATELSRTTAHQVIVLGGPVRPGIFATWGPYAEEMLTRLAVNKAFMAADAVHAQHGVMNATTEEVRIKQLMIQASRHRYLLADHSKFMKTALAWVAGLDAFEEVITDSGLPSQLRSTLTEIGVRLTIVEVGQEEPVTDEVASDEGGTPAVGQHSAASRQYDG
ncbi:MAG: DeoR/GlpR transcriptional regulator [Limnochordaceae bacterium]|nr:DeoR/GlpR transcriptional regulator [Limnochordaceae bacterium]